MAASVVKRYPLMREVQPGFSLESDEEPSKALQTLPQSDSDPEAENEEEEEFGGFEENAEEQEDDEAADMIPEKDDSEEELEKLIFGDSAGFREGIRSFALSDRTIGGAAQEVADEEEEDLQGIADADLFFFDSGPGDLPAGVSQAVTRTQTEDEEKPAWEDSDDERMFVSLASVPRLRKLRKTEEEDVVDGREYVRRLRGQYERLYPTPKWAKHVEGKTKKKRRRDVGLGESEDSDSAEDMDLDDEGDLRIQPLAKLLQDADLLSRTSSGPRKKRKLQPGTIDIQRLKDITGTQASAITSLSFHPTLPLLLSSGPSSTLYLHQITPSSLPRNQPANPLLTSFHIKHTPLATTAFDPSPTSSRIFLSARRRFFHIWDLSTGSIEKVTRVYGHQHEQRSMEHFSLSPDGKYMALRGSSKKGGGVVNILDALTLQWTTQLRIDARNGVADLAWWSDSSGLCVAGKNGEITEWDLQTQRVVARWNDEGAVGTTTLALGGRSGRGNWIGGDRWLVVGSSSGIVNIYDRREWHGLSLSSSTPSSTSLAETPNLGIPRNPKPTRTLDNLTTPISHLAFSPDGQVLAIASRWKSGALRLVHLPSCTVFRNWPTDKTPLGRVTAVAWGGAGVEEGVEARLAVANEMGAVRLWEVRA